MLFTSLHRELGRRPGPITPEMITAAITEGIAETDDLDWKAKLYDEKNLKQSDYPKDVAAMANRGGGVIVLGVDETDKRAASIVDVGEITEGYERTLASIAVSAITPPVFGIAVHSIATPQGTVVAVVVPGSVDGPHLIYRNDYFGAPVRNGPNTAWMREREVEAMYRARFDARKNAAGALDALYDEAVIGRDANNRAWLIGVAHPRLPVTEQERPTVESAREILRAAEKHSCSLVFADAATHPLDCVDRFGLRAGLRRWVAPNARTGRRLWAESWVGIHYDGSVTLASAIGGRSEIPDANLRGNIIVSPDVEAAVADVLGVVRATSLLRGIDEFDIRIGIESNLSEPTVIGFVDFARFIDEFSTPLARYTPVSATIRSGSDWDSFHEQAQGLALDCVNQGGLTQLRVFNK